MRIACGNKLGSVHAVGVSIHSLNDVHTVDTFTWTLWPHWLKRTFTLWIAYGDTPQRLYAIGVPVHRLKTVSILHHTMDLPHCGNVCISTTVTHAVFTVYRLSSSLYQRTHYVLPGKYNILVYFLSPCLQIYILHILRETIPRRPVFC